MERLTQMVHPGLGYCWTKLAFSDVAIMEDMIIDRLGAYEDTGLTPEEIISIQKENTELKELLKLVVSDVFNTNDCEICSDIEECTLRETFNGHCGFWKWQHADKLKELGVE